MPKPQMSKLDIMNLMGKAANQKARQAPDAGEPDDQEDALNSQNPKAKKSPASKPKQAAAINAKKKKLLPPQMPSEE